MKPAMQIHAMLLWFQQAGVSLFDLHLRVPRSPGTDYYSGDWFMITAHEEVDAERITGKLFHWLRYRNAMGADIFIRPCRLRAQSVLFLDDLPMHRARMVAGKYSSCVIETSPGNTQVWIAIDRSLLLSDRKRAQRRIASLGFSDPASISGDHLGRLCGMRSQKRKCWVNLIATTSGKKYSPVMQGHSLPLGGGCASRKDDPAKGSPSEQEFGWVLGRLRCGISSEIVRNDLLKTATSRGKRNASAYVGRTMKNAEYLLDRERKMSSIT